MRINQFIAQASGLSRRSADAAIREGRVLVNNRPTVLGQSVTVGDTVTLDGHSVRPPFRTTLILLNKPIGYVCSRSGQGSRTVYDLLPDEYSTLKTVGRLDKNSSGLLLLTDDGHLAYLLTHPSFNKVKVYEVTLDRLLAPKDLTRLDSGVPVDTYVSHLKVSMLHDTTYTVTMTQGRNRQIRRTFGELGYDVKNLHRVQFGGYDIGTLKNGEFSQSVLPISDNP